MDGCKGEGEAAEGEMEREGLVKDFDEVEVGEEGEKGGGEKGGGEKAKGWGGEAEPGKVPKVNDEVGETPKVNAGGTSSEVFGVFSSGVSVLMVLMKVLMTVLMTVLMRVWSL